MDAATIVRHALEALRKPLTLKEALSSVADFRIDRKKKYPLYEILMIAVCAMIDGAKGPTSGALRAKCLSNQQPSIQCPVEDGRKTSIHWPLRCWLLVAETLRPQAAQWEADTPPFTGCWLLAAGCWNTSAAGRPKVCMVESVVYDKSTGKTCRASREVFQQPAASIQRPVEKRRSPSSLSAVLLAAGYWDTSAAGR